MSDMSDFEQWWESDGKYTRSGGGDYEKSFAYAGYQAAKQSMQGEAVATIQQKYLAANEHGMFAYTVYSDKELSVGNKFYAYAANLPPVAWLLRLKIGGEIERFVRFHPNEGGQPLFTHAPDSAARIDEQDAEIARLTKELEEARKVPDGYALVPIEPTEKMVMAIGAKYDDLKAMAIANYKAMLSAASDASLNIKGGAE